MENNGDLLLFLSKADRFMLSRLSRNGQVSAVLSAALLSLADELPALGDVEDFHRQQTRLLQEKHSGATRGWGDLQEFEVSDEDRRALHRIAQHYGVGNQAFVYRLALLLLFNKQEQAMKERNS